MINLGDLPTLVHVLGVVFKQNGKKQNRDSTGSRTRETLFKFKYKFTMTPSSNINMSLGFPSLLNQAR
jgi:hypothetical protein